MEVDLPALAWVRHQLRNVTMSKCLLLSSCWPAAGTKIFATGWDKLEKLDLSRSSIDTHITAVSMPSLQRLMLKGFTVRDDAGEALHGSMEAFALGCPCATYVELEPVLRLAPGPYQFAALDRLRLALDPVLLREADVAWDNHMDVPSSLAALELMSSAKNDMDDWGPDPHVCISLRSALSVAVANIKAGARLQSVTFAHCNTMELMLADDDVEDGAHMVEPNEAEAVQLYRPLASALHGLVRLDLLFSAGCGQAVVNEVVSSAPSLKSLLLCIDAPDFVHSRKLACSGLQELHLEYHLWQLDREGPAFGFTASLEDAAALRCCTVEVLDEGNNAFLHQGDSITLVVACHEMASITGIVRCTQDNFYWVLGFKVRVPANAEGSGQKQAIVSCVYDKDECGWACAVE